MRSNMLISLLSILIIVNGEHRSSRWLKAPSTHYQLTHNFPDQIDWEIKPSPRRKIPSRHSHFIPTSPIICVYGVRSTKWYGGSLLLLLPLLLSSSSLPSSSPPLPSGLELELFFTEWYEAGIIVQPGSEFRSLLNSGARRLGAVM